MALIVSLDLASSMKKVRVKTLCAAHTTLLGKFYAIIRAYFIHVAAGRLYQDQSSPGSGFAKTLVESVSKALFHASEACDSVQGEEEANSSGGGGGEVDFSDRCRSKLPPAEELARQIWGEGSGRSIDTQRQLRIMTWGDRLMKAGAVTARGSQWNINAKPLNGRGGGANVHRNALQARCWQHSR